MKIVAVVFAALACCLPGAGQQAQGGAQPPVRKSENQLAPNVRIYEPKNLTPSRAVVVANFVQSVGNVRVYWDDVPHAIVIRGGNAQDQDTAEALVRRFDTPEQGGDVSHQIDCTIYLIRASKENASSKPPPTSPVPDELQPAVEEMKHTFSQYSHYALWDAIVLQPKGAGDLQGILPSNGQSHPYVYNVAYSGIGPTGSRSLTLYGFQFSIKIPFGTEGIDSHIKTDVTVREGQKLVLGKIRLLPIEDADLFLVLATKLH